MHSKTTRNKYKTKENSKRKRIIIIAITLLIIIAVIFLIKNNNKTAKTSKIGNNSTSQEIIEYILNISSYETEISVEIKSNKNSHINRSI